MGTSSETTKEKDGENHGEQEQQTTSEATPSDTNTDHAIPPHSTSTRTGETQPPPASYDQHAPPNIRDLQPQQRRPGDFDRDLLPGVGVNDPAGNLMGPNHPAFHGGTQPVGGGGGYGMRPRFDPFGPPGGPTDPRNLDPSRAVDPNDPRNPQLPRQPRPPPGGSGDPNPDHERPPNDLNNNIFM